MSREYDLYLENHKANVKKGFDWIKEHVPELILTDDGIDYEHQICFAHDASKSEPDEYEAYDSYFYGGNRSYQVVQDFNYAWLMHIHRNPHHWQHWVLHNDEPGEGMVVMDMPYNYILEMICDWWAFSWNSEDLKEIFDWYDKHKDYMKISDKTRKTVEEILNKIRERLEFDGIGDIAGIGWDEIELCHHGIKGQKWGVKNGPPYPIDKSRRHDTIVKDAIESGQVSKEINHEKQLRHTKSHHIPGRSYLDGDLEYAQELVDKLSGTGEAKFDSNGNWTRKEMVTNSDGIGTHINPVNGKETRTNKATIIYSKTGAHIYPRLEED